MPRDLCDPLWFLQSAEQYQEMVNQVMSTQITAQRAAIVKFRKLLAHEDIHPYLDKIIESGVLPTFVHMLRREQLPELQVFVVDACFLHACCVLTYLRAYYIVRIRVGLDQHIRGHVHSNGIGRRSW